MARSQLVSALSCVGSASRSEWRIRTFALAGWHTGTYPCGSRCPESTAPRTTRPASQTSGRAWVYRCTGRHKAVPSRCPVAPSNNQTDNVSTIKRSIAGRKLTDDFSSIGEESAGPCRGGSAACGEAAAVGKAPGVRVRRAFACSIMRWKEGETESHGFGNAVVRTYMIEAGMTCANMGHQRL